MLNERITEDIVRNHFKNDPLFKSVKFEEQKSYNKRVVDLLQTASKSGKGVGKPEFIISFPAGNIDYILVIECKASVADHHSKRLDNPKDYAVDGVLHYAKALSEEFDVVAIAVSGQTEQELLVSHFVWRKGENQPTENKEDKKLLSINNYLKLFNNEQFADNLRNIDIIQKAIFLNEEYQAYSITEMTRCTMVSAILLSLLNEPFRISYKTHSTSGDLGKAMLSAIESVLAQNEIKNKGEMIGEYSKILNEPILKQKTVKHKNKKEHELSIEVAKGMIEYLHSNVYPLVDMEQSGFDVLGRFYTEFIRYAGSEQSQGLVLTPAHITDLFCDLANVSSNDVIYDPCCGTGGFLIAGMKRMFNLAGNDEEKKQNIKSKQLVGVELRPSMYTYACSNMMMRGDGKSNIYCGDCFAFESIVKDHHRPTVAFLNPPYDVGNAGQMLFIEHALNAVSAQNGTVVAIVQMSCGIGEEKELVAVKKRILDKHHLKAALSMPNELFAPKATVVTCVMVFETNKKNEGRETWFGYFKDDKFEKRKNQGRIDARGLFKEEKKRWLNAYHNSKEIAGLSIKQEVTANNEWCAEAYMETDYTILREQNFIDEIRKYAAYKILHLENNNLNVEHNTASKDVFSLDTDLWEYFNIADIFGTIEKCKCSNATALLEEGNDIFYIGAKKKDNGVMKKVEMFDELVTKGNCILFIGDGQGSVGYSTYQPVDFIGSTTLSCGYNKNLNQYNSLFIVTVLDLERYKYSFGRKYGKSQLLKAKIKLPAKGGQPDWQFMEDYIKSLPYSKLI